MNILVIDAQGGGLGKQLITALKKNFPDMDITAVGTNTMARINGMVIGIVYCYESLSLSTTEPVAA